jgi:hypothetical protein
LISWASVRSSRRIFQHHRCFKIAAIGNQRQIGISSPPSRSLAELSSSTSKLRRYFLDLVAHRHFVFRLRARGGAQVGRCGFLVALSITSGPERQASVSRTLRYKILP